MKKTSLKKVVSAAGIGLAAAIMAANPQAKAPAAHANVIHEAKAVTPSQRRVSSKIVNEIGGLPIVTYIPAYGMSPKEYGILYGHGNGKGKTNFLKLSHCRKVAKRRS